jgi:Rrf2 family protein
MLDLAVDYGNGPVTLKEVSKRQDISEKYLWHLIPPLKTAGLVTSARGSRGGYTLSKPPGSINLLEIFSALEGSACLVECTEHPSMCRRSATCIAREVWAEASKKMFDYLASLSLEKLVERQKSKQDKFSYAI